MPYGTPVTVLEYLGEEEDRFGNEQPSWAPAGPTYDECAIDSQSSEPVAPQEDTVVVTGKVYGPFDMEVHPKDKVRIRGVEWDVVGEVWREQNPFTGSRPGCWFGIQRTVVA
jgi:hypothetical protein